MKVINRSWLVICFYLNINNLFVCFVGVGYGYLYI